MSSRREAKMYEPEDFEIGDRIENANVSPDLAIELSIPLTRAEFRAISDIAKRRVQVVVVYKVDRLTRSLADFAKLVELFDANGVSFVSVTQQFNTTTSMGRLTLNVLLSFAQFEREVTGERIRDKIAASKRKGMWMGGPVPLGYEVDNRKLIINQTESDLVRHIYQRYLELNSVVELADELNQQGHRTKVRQRTSGPHKGGCNFWPRHRRDSDGQRDFRYSIKPRLSSVGKSV